MIAEAMNHTTRIPVSSHARMLRSASSLTTHPLRAIRATRRLVLALHRKPLAALATDRTICLLARLANRAMRLGARNYRHTQDFDRFYEASVNGACTRNRLCSLWSRLCVLVLLQDLRDHSSLTPCALASPDSDENNNHDERAEHCIPNGNPVDRAHP